MKPLAVMVAALALAAPTAAGEPNGLLPPVQIQAGGRPLDIERDGHAAPFVGDFFGDGSLALLVGQFHEGRLRVYRNTGTRAAPKFEAYEWFRAGGKIALVPEG